jgi:UDP-glucose 4-epimerase
LKLVLVTGATGFIGRTLVKDLVRAGHRVRAASRMPPQRDATQSQGAEDLVEWVQSPDLAHEADWGPYLSGVDAVIHAAAIAHTRAADASAYEAINHRAVAALAGAARGKVERFIFLSSIRAQTGPACASVLSEADAPRPTDAYGRSKLAAEQALRETGTPFVILRPVLVAGPHPSGNLAAMLRVARLPLPLRLDALSARRSLVALADMTTAVIHVLDEASHLGETYIVAHPDPIRIGEMFAALKEGLGRKSGSIPAPAGLLRAALGLPGLRDMQEKLFGDLVAASRTLMATGWTPRLSPREALREIGKAAC